MSRISVWQIIPYLLPIISYLIGRSRNRLKVPKPIEALIENPRVIGVIVEGVEAAQTMKGKSDDEKREYVRSWAKSELHKLLGEWLPDSAVNFLIEHVVVRSKG